MASPTVAATNTSEETTATSSHGVDLPAGVVSGNLIVSVFSSDGDSTVSFPAGYTEFFELMAGSRNTLSFAYRQADGGEGASFTVTTSADRQSAHVTYRITGHENPATQAPEASTGATETSLDTNPDPDSITPTGGSKDYLFIAAHGHNNDRTTTAFPTSYSNGLSEQGSGGGACGVASAERQLTATSEDPGTFTISAGAEWVAATIAIHPGAAVTGIPSLVMAPYVPA